MQGDNFESARFPPREARTQGGLVQHTLSPSTLPKGLADPRNHANRDCHSLPGGSHLHHRSARHGCTAKAAKRLPRRNSRVKRQGPSAAIGPLPQS